MEYIKKKIKQNIIIKKTLIQIQFTFESEQGFQTFSLDF